MTLEQSNLKKIQIFILDTLFPIKCISCGEESAWICAKCLSRIKTSEKNICPICEKTTTPDGRTCFSCKKHSSLDGLIVTASYKDELISRAIHFYKYRFISDLHEPLARLMINALRKTDIPICDIIVPIPLHKKRLRWRGFNQSELLTNYISANFLPEFAVNTNVGVIERIKHTKPQMKVRKFNERKENISGAFIVKNIELIKGKSILLVDDVATTGATIFECAKSLKEAGASEVFAIVIARQEIRNHFAKQ